jgi:hypothetical protein
MRVMLRKTCCEGRDVAGFEPEVLVYLLIIKGDRWKLHDYEIECLTYNSCCRRVAFGGTKSSSGKAVVLWLPGPLGYAWGEAKLMFADRRGWRLRVFDIHRQQNCLVFWQMRLGKFRSGG